MNSEAWLASDNAEELLCFAAPRIPREHLALVLTEIAEATVYSWSVCYPRDWRLPLGVATLRVCRTEVVRARLDRKVKRLAVLRPLPVSVEAMFAVLVVSPLLLGFAFAISWRVSHTAAWHAVASSTPSQVPLWVAGFPKRPGVT